jgi:uncharacterized membrane protein YgcG
LSFFHSSHFCCCLEEHRIFSDTNQPKPLQPLHLPHLFLLELGTSCLKMLGGRNYLLTVCVVAAVVMLLVTSSSPPAVVEAKGGGGGGGKGKGGSKGGDKGGGDSQASFLC